MATDFEGYTHQQLKAMIASLDPETAKARAAQLKKASEDIAKIAEKLKKHRVTGWEGEGAVAFQEWVGRAGNATLRLSEYSAEGSKWMTDAVQKMVEASKMPAYDTDAAANLEAAKKFHNDPDSQQIRQESSAKLNSEHAEAVKLMKALAESYEQSSTQMNKAEIPTFPPPPQAFVPTGYNPYEDVARDGGGTGTAERSGYTDVPSSPTSRDRSNDPGWVPGHPPQTDSTRPPATTLTPPPVPLTPDRDVSVGLDHVATLPPPTTLPQGPVTPGGPLPTGPTGVGPVLPPVSLPPFSGPTVPTTGPGRVGTLPGLSGPTLPGGGKFGGSLPGLPPRDTGILGGKPVSTSGPSSSIPRGTVIGAEGTQAGRGMNGMMGGGAHGGTHAGVGGPSTGRRLASEPGGIVGGRQPVTGGGTAKAGQPFTQGGSGLVRNNAGGAGAAPMSQAGAGARTPGKRRDDHGGERPDYLAEDEETWQSNRRVAPPVID
ncbi:WXG100 family type VII secretion target [Streptomyces sp. CB00455]|uniref:WXG100 family type VII secretion target n=1 Tax=Streptomyces sp. CB00455 TaxID=1703927 RepID=UPI0009391892|nr:hypothetical protein [Streptomyces sp. CB00455]